MDQSSRRTWVSVLIAAVIIIGMLAAAAVGGTAFFFYRHVHTEVTPNDHAEKQFADARARFAGQQALIEIQKDDRALLHREVIPASGSPARLVALRVLAYDTHGSKLVNVSIPFWLIRMAPSRRFSFINSGVDFDSDRVHLTLDDLERRGPGLILDQADRRGSQVLVWTE
jgi:hypothetical protein